jgi:DNA-binding transcriptional LysR family regulator
MVTNVTMVAAGMGVSAVPASMRDIHRESVVFKRVRKSSRVYAPITLATRRDDHNPVVQRFAALARDLARAA